jgi:hypothetical protein
MNEISNLIMTLGFPIVAAVALFFGCRFLIENNNKYIERMFDMYDKANAENREAIKACTQAIDKLCDKLDDMR